ncbi:MAG TPA: ATP-binding cassette domain-containing protein, partial [Candidatus Bathyarchaeia archaeon]|nr:ATP-binding cassette domain-containing protein [Candidatus Bathyarchaeia archaeon]
MTIGAGVKFNIKDLSVWFGQVQALKKVTLAVQSNEILSIIGPSNSGKTTFLRMLNRLNALNLNFRMEGEIKIDGDDLLRIDIEALRKRVGMVFALPLSLPLSIYDNVAYG